MSRSACRRRSWLVTLLSWPPWPSMPLHKPAARWQTPSPRQTLSCLHLTSPWARTSLPRQGRPARRLQKPPLEIPPTSRAGSASATTPPSVPSWSTWWAACPRGTSSQVPPRRRRARKASVGRGRTKTTFRKQTQGCPDARAPFQDPDVRSGLS